MNFERLIGTKEFYKKLLRICMPIIAQNVITYVMSLVDTVLLSSLGTPQLSGVAIANQLLAVASSAAVGAANGVGLFCAQQYGSGDHAGVRRSFRFKIIICGTVLLLALAVFFLGGEKLISLYLTADEDPQERAAALYYAKQYLWVVALSLPMYFADQVYASTLRQCGETRVPMVAGITAILLNIALDAALIHGFFGLGVLGAALAMLLARTVQAFITIGWTHRHPEKMPFIRKEFKSVRLTALMVKTYTMKSVPLIFNEAIYSVGNAVIVQSYSLYGLKAVAGMNISNTLGAVFSTVIGSFGVAVAIWTGMLLGAGDMKKAKDYNAKMVAAGMLLGFLLCGVQLLLAPLLPGIYSAEEEVRELAVRLLRVAAVYLPITAGINMSYNTLHAGGRIKTVFLYDCGFMWLLNVPLAFFLSRYAQIDVVTLYLICCLAETLRAGLGLFLIRRGAWLQNLSNVQ